jgi:hypothetical protein
MWSWSRYAITRYSTVSEHLFVHLGIGCESESDIVLAVPQLNLKLVSINAPACVVGQSNAEADFSSILQVLSWGGYCKQSCLGLSINMGVIRSKLS